MIAVEVEFTPEVSAKFNGKVEFKQKVGCAYSSKSGFRNLSEKPELDAEVNFEGTIFIGFALTPSVEALFGVVELGLECKLGAEGTGTRVLTTTDTKESDHLCRWCIDGTISGKAEISVELETGFWKKWKHTLSVKLIDWEKKLFDFYYSANNGFGKGECPNRKEPEHNDPEPYTGKFPENSGVAENFDASAYCYADYADYSNYITTYTYINGRGDFDFYEYKDALIPFTSNSYDWCTSDWYKDYGYYNLLYWGQGYYKNIVYINGFDAVNYCALMPSPCNDEMVIITGPTKCVNLYGGYINCGYINPELVSLPDSVTAVRNSKYNEDYYLSYSNTDIPCYINDINVSFPPSIKHIEGYNNRPYPNGKYDDDRYDYNAYASIKSVTFPPSTEYVDGFNENPITSLTLPQPDTTLTIKGFYRCPIEELIIPPNVSIIDCDINDYLLGLVKCKSFTNLKKVTLQSDMTKLDGRDMLEEVYFDEPLTAVIDDCCRDCPNLKTISFAPTVTSIGKNAFNGTGLESVTIPSTVKKISEGAFANCPDLEEVIIEDGVMEIDKNAFANCPNLKRVIVPSSVVILDHRAFNDCTPVVVIDYSGTARDWMSIIGEYELNNNKLTERKMSELTAVSPIYKNCIICCGTKNRKGGESVGASADDCHPGTEYLIAVEDAENGMLNGQITTLYQVSADKNGQVAIPDDITAGEGEYLNLYGACRHPSTHLTENNRNICNVCGARLPAIIDRGMLPDDPGIAVGDANLDGKLDIRDVTAIQRHVAEFKILTGDAFLAADANGDGAVTIEDATYLQMYFAEYGVVLG